MDLHDMTPQALHHPPTRQLTALELQASAWVRRVATGDMTPADGRLLRQWCQASPSHVAALKAAQADWSLLREAARLSMAHRPIPAASVRSAAEPQRGWGRRAWLAGALGAGGMAAIAGVVAPPMGLWPSLDELQADWRTDVGEQRRVALGGDVSLQLNTRTSVSVWSGEAGGAGIDLIAGEAAIDMGGHASTFSVRAGGGRALADQAQFEVRHRVQDVCVTCLHGRVQVLHASGASAWLQAREQLVYDLRTLGAARAVDPGRVSAWREGFLRFVDTPLADVVEEINRYRRGQVIVLNRRMAARQVTGRFRIQTLDVAIAQIQQSLGLQMRTLPGGIVLLD